MRMDVDRAIAVSGLTEYQEYIIRRWSDGFTKKQIAQELYRSEGGVVRGFYGAILKLRRKNTLLNDYKKCG